MKKYDELRKVKKLDLSYVSGNENKWEKICEKSFQSDYGDGSADL